MKGVPPSSLQLYFRCWKSWLPPNVVLVYNVLMNETCQSERSILGQILTLQVEEDLGNLMVVKGVVKKIHIPSEQ